MYLISLPSSGQSSPGTSGAEQRCPPLSAPSGAVIYVSTVSELENAVAGAVPNSTILLADGTYNLNGAYLRFDAPGLTLRSTSGNREAVVLDGNYVTTEIIQIVASDVTIADLTLREAYYHPIHVMSSEAGDTLNTLIYNVHIVDPGEQAIKINPASEGVYPDDGVVACSTIELTDVGRTHIRNNCYTGGIDAHQAQGWTIRDNLIQGFWCEQGLSEHAVHMWRGSRDTLVEQNALRDNARGIGFGLATSGDGRTYLEDPCPSAAGGYVDHYGGVVRNNFVSVDSHALFASEYGFDCGICMWQACGAKVLHNTVASTQAPFSSIEWRFDHTDVDIVNNLVTHNLLGRGGAAQLSGNLVNQPMSLFVDGPAGDLHLASAASAAIDQGVSLSVGLCDDDIDGDTRPIGLARDVGADEYGVPPPPAVNDLHVLHAVAGSRTLTATLGWTNFAGVVTSTLRYADRVITEGTWANSSLLSQLPGSSSEFKAVVPYDGKTVYFAIKTQNTEGDWSKLSNNAFWPRWDFFLPFVLKVQ